MGELLRRRAMMAVPESGPVYPYESNYPEFNEFGTWTLIPLSGTSSSNGNAYLSSGTTGYTYIGGVARNTAFRLIITDTTITIRYLYSQGGAIWKSKAFAGFPVKFKRCSGTANGKPFTSRTGD